MTRIVATLVLAGLAAAGSACDTTVVTPSEIVITRLIAVSHRAPGPAPGIDGPLASGPLQFGTVAVGSVGDARFEISNNGTAPLTVSSIEGLDPDIFTPNYRGGVIEPGYFQRVTVRFQPRAAREYSGTIVVVADQTHGNGRLDFIARGVLR